MAAALLLTPVLSVSWAGTDVAPQDDSLGRKRVSSAESVHGEVGPEASVSMEALDVSAKRVPFRDRVRPRASQVEVEKASGELDLNPALQRIPGVQVRSSSGPASVVTAYPAFSPSSDVTSVGIDEFNLSNGLRVGFNTSLLAPSSVGGVGLQYPFSSAVQPMEDMRPAPGGRLKIHTAHYADRPRWAGAWSASTLSSSHAFGSGQGDVSWRHPRWVVAASSMATDGAYRFRHPVSRQVDYRGGNEAWGTGLLAKTQRDIGAKTKLNILTMGSLLRNSAAGGLDFPSKTKVESEFLLVGVHLKNPRFGGRGSYNLSTVRTKEGVHLSGNDRMHNGFFQAQGKVFGPLELTVDEEWSRLLRWSDSYTRFITGLSARWEHQWDQWQGKPTAWPWSLSAVVRQEFSNQTTNIRDYRFGSLVSHEGEGWSGKWGGGFSFDHLHPSILSYTGYVADGFRVLPHRDLGVERHRVWSLHQVISFTRKGRTDEPFLVWQQQLFFDHMSQQNVLPYSFSGVSRYESLPSSRIVGTTTSLQWNPLDPLVLRGDMTWTHSEDRKYYRALAFKPRMQGLFSLGVHPLPASRSLLVAAQSQFLGRRYYATAGSFSSAETLDPLWLFHLRADWKFLPRWSAFVRVDNLMDRGAWSFPGYPLPGRSFWFGMNWGED